VAFYKFDLTKFVAQYLDEVTVDLVDDLHGLSLPPRQVIEQLF